MANRQPSGRQSTGRQSTGRQSTGRQPSERRPADRQSAQQRSSERRPTDTRQRVRTNNQRKPSSGRRPPVGKTVRVGKDEKIRYNADGTITRFTKKKERLFGIRSGIDLPFLILLIALVIIGLIMMFSASYYYAYNNNGSSYYYVLRQGIFAVLGVAVMFGISFLDYHVLHRMAIPILVISWIFLAAARVLPGVAGVHRWINLGLFSFQPSEIAKFAVILWLAHYISIHSDKMKKFVSGVLPNLFVVGVTALLIIIEPHYSATIILFLLAGILLFIGGVQKRWFAIALIMLAVVGVLFLTLSESYAGDRVQGWMDPFNEQLWQSTWQTRNSLYAIGSGGFFGLGLGQSRQKYLWLPEPQNDFIFAVVCEELGFIGAILILALFALLVWRGIRISLQAPDKFGMLLGTGLSLQVGLQAMLNIFVVTNLIPNTGISLPFFSYGGTSLIILLAEMGIVLSISRTSRISKL